MSELDPQLERNYVFYLFIMFSTEDAVIYGPALKYVIVGFELEIVGLVSDGFSLVSE